jgi:hypothetical protein
VATFCVGTVGVGCLVVGGAALGYGAYTSYQRWSDPNVSAQDKLNLAADWAGGIAGGAGLLRAGVGGTATAARTPAQESRAIIQRAADEVTARGPGWLEQWLSAGQLKAIAKNPGLRPAYLGYRYHQAVAKAIPENLRGRITYSYRGVDFTDSLLQTRIELTTVGDLAAHQLQYGVPTPILDYVTYTLPGG